ncbi:hypothetical protein A2U01_0017444, partial [Trifolium medium]
MAKDPVRVLVTGAA